MDAIPSADEGHVFTEGGKGKRNACMFPFLFGGQEYSECTTAGHGQPWCSLTEDYDKDGLWGNCILGKFSRNNLNLYNKSIFLLKGIQTHIDNAKYLKPLYG